MDHREQRGLRKVQQPGCDISVPLRFWSSRKIWSADPDYNDSSNQIGEPNDVFLTPVENPDRHWKTVDYKVSGQVKILESEQAELTKIFDRHLADVNSDSVNSWLRTVSAEIAH